MTATSIDHNKRARETTMCRLAHYLFAAGLIAPAFFGRPAVAQDEFAANAKRIFAALDKKISVNFEEDPLQDALRSLGRLTGIRVTLDVKAIRKAGFKPSKMLITYSKKNRSLRSVLSALVGGRFKWSVEEDGLTVTSLPAAFSRPTIRRYPVKELLAAGYGKKPLARAIRISMTASPKKTRSVAITSSTAMVRCNRSDHQRVRQMLGGVYTARRPKQKRRPARRFGSDFHKGVLAEQERIAKELASETEADLVNYPLQDCVGYFADLHNITIIIDEQAMKREKIPLDAPVSLKVKKVKLNVALDLMNKKFGLDFIIEDEVMKISTKKALAKRLETRVYRLAKTADAAKLAARIKKTVATETWKPDAGRIVVLRQTLVVRQSQPVHRAIERLLKSLEKPK